MTVPLHLLNQLDERRCDWLVPGLLRDKISHLIRGLPKNLRKHFVPVPQYVTAVLEVLEPGDRPLLPALSDAILRKTGVEVPLDAWDLADLPPFLRMNFKVVDDDGKRAGDGSRHLPALRAQLGVKARRQFSESARQPVRAQGADQLGFRRAARTGRVHPRRPDADRLSGAGRRRRQSVALTLLDTEHDAEVATHRGLRRLFQLAAPEQVKHRRAQPAGLSGHGAALCAAARARRRQAGQGRGVGSPARRTDRSDLRSRLLRRG